MVIGSAWSVKTRGGENDGTARTGTAEGSKKALGGEGHRTTRTGTAVNSKKAPARSTIRGSLSPKIGDFRDDERAPLSRTTLQ